MLFSLWIALKDKQKLSITLAKRFFSSDNALFKKKKISDEFIWYIEQKYIYQLWSRFFFYECIDTIRYAFFGRGGGGREKGGMRVAVTLKGEESWILLGIGGSIVFGGPKRNQTIYSYHPISSNVSLLRDVALHQIVKIGLLVALLFYWWGFGWFRWDLIIASVE